MSNFGVDTKNLHIIMDRGLVHCRSSKKQAKILVYQEFRPIFLLALLFSLLKLIDAIMICRGYLNLNDHFS